MDRDSTPARDVEERVAGLILRMRALEAELQELTNGQLDSVAVGHSGFSLLPDAQASLVLREANFRAIFDHAGIGIAVMQGPDGEIMQCNQAFGDMLGQAAWQVRGQTLRALSHPTDFRASQSAWLAVLGGDADRLQYEIRLRRLDGDYAWGRLTATAARTADGAAADVIVGIVEDVSARKQAEAETARIHRALTMLTRCNQALTRASDESALLHEVSHTIIDAGGYRLAWVGLIDAQDPKGHLTPAVVAAADDATRQAFETELHAMGSRDADLAACALETGELQSLAGTLAFPLRDPDGMALGTLVIDAALKEDLPQVELALLRDLAADLAFGIAGARARAARETQARELQEQAALLLELNTGLESRVAARTAALADANRELEAFSYSVSHDLRAPLGAMDGFAVALERHTQGRLGPKESHYLQRIRAAAARMSDLIDGLLLLGQVSKERLHHQTVDLSALATSTLDALCAAEPQRQVQLQIAAGLTVTGDANLLSILLVNLLGNAWKYSARVDCAQISVGRLSPGDGDGDGTFYVRDNGAGFDMEGSEQQLFQPFHRFHSAHDFPGNGVGLATARRIVERHDGRIWAQSKPGEGAVFYFTLSGRHGALARPLPTRPDVDATLG